MKRKSEKERGKKEEGRRKREEGRSHLLVTTNSRCPMPDTSTSLSTGAQFPNPQSPIPNPFWILD